MTVDEQLGEAHRLLLEDLIAEDAAHRDKELRSLCSTAFEEVMGVKPHIEAVHCTPFGDEFVVAGTRWRVGFADGRYYLIVFPIQGGQISVHRPADLEGVSFESLA